MVLTVLVSSKLHWTRLKDKGNGDVLDDKDEDNGIMEEENFGCQIRIVIGRFRVRMNEEGNNHM